MLSALQSLYRTCRDAQVPALPTLLAFYWRKRLGVNLLARPGTVVRQLRNLHTHGVLNVGVSYVGFTLPTDKALLNLGGQLLTHDNVTIGQGCRLDIGSTAVVEIGRNSYINPNTRLVIMHGLRIGADCAISWDCQFLDEDFHTIHYEGQRPCANPCIVLGDRVWIGSRVSVFKGVTLAAGCVVASGSNVTYSCEEENCLLAGSPARVVRRNVQWL